MPDSSKRGIQSTSKTILCAIGTALQVSKALCAETGFQAPKVRSHSSDFIRFTPGKVLTLTTPSAFCRCPGKTISEQSQVTDGPSASTSVEGSIPDLGG
eukprot:3148548-Amphidinium_carterae.1